MRERFRFHAEICRSIAHPKRLEILNLLRRGRRSVGELAELMDISPANVSQQLAVLRHAGVVRRAMEGTSAYYSISDVRVLEAYDLMTQVMEEQLAERTKAVRQGRPPSGHQRRNR